MAFGGGLRSAIGLLWRAAYSAIGGPAAYGLAWVVFLVGMVIIGAQSYTVGKQYGAYLLKLFIERYQSQRENRSSEIKSGSSSNNSSTDK